MGPMGPRAEPVTSQEEYYGRDLSYNVSIHLYKYYIYLLLFFNRFYSEQKLAKHELDCSRVNQPCRITLPK